jgi:hypothetical protein
MPDFFTQKQKETTSNKGAKLFEKKSQLFSP